MAAVAPGTVISNYRIEGEIGCGGMGVVYRAIQRTHTFERQVALKLIRPEYAHDPEFRRRFIRESRNAAALGHPNVIPVIEADEEDGQLFIAMQYVQGEDLDALIARRGPLPASTAVRLLSEVAGALDAAHARGLVHRDVKPPNILVSGSEPHEEVYLTDFGLALATGATRMSSEGRFAGTFDYAAPEQFVGADIGAQTDVYALGCVLYTTLVGHPPFADREHAAAKMFAHTSEAPPDASRARPGLPTAIDRVIARAMAKRPADRHPSATALCEAAREAVREPDRPARAPRRRAALRDAATRLRQGVRPSRRRMGAILAGLLVAALAATAVVLSGIGFAPLGGNEAGPRRVASLAVGGSPAAIAMDDAALWVLDAAESTLSRYDLASGEAAPERLPIGGSTASALAVGGGAVWVAHDDGSLSRHDPRSGEMVWTAAVVQAADDVGVGEGGVWVLDGDADAIAVVDVAEEATTVRDAAITVRGAGDDLAVGGGAVWVTREDGGVSRVDPASGAVTHPSIVIGGHVTAVAAGAGEVWVADSGAAVVTRIDPDSLEVAGTPIRVGAADDLAVGREGVWVADAGEGAVRRAAQ